jgi:hypothetical protein
MVTLKASIAYNETELLNTKMPKSNKVNVSTFDNFSPALYKEKLFFFTRFFLCVCFILQWKPFFAIDRN